MMKIGIIGCGNLGMSILKGIKLRLPDSEVIASKRDIKSLANETTDKISFTTDNSDVINQCDILIIALKPYTIIPFLNEYKTQIDAKRHTVISAATGIQISEIEAIIKGVGVYRVMPNTASSVNSSITAICSNKDPLERQVIVNDLFSAIGETVEIDETLMESATILGACGIAYVLRFMRAMIQGGIEVGFDAKTATKIVAQTIKGASELIISNGTHPEQEIDKVTTPKGCTIVGLNEMEHAGFSSALIKGIVTSYEKIERK
jgi:pyrroline-5-carboxylate reductase